MLSIRSKGDTRAQIFSAISQTIYELCKRRARSDLATPSRVHNYGTTAIVRVWGAAPYNLATTCNPTTGRGENAPRR
jgi:hypothetical protein